jgi:threonyl-tRNA synthetase
VVKDVLGREWQLGTVQVDYNLPIRFGLKYVGSDGKSHVPVMIHRAPFGSMERFTGVLIEHFAGNFPLWLSPEQVRVLPINDDPVVIEYCDAIVASLRGEGVRCERDTSPDSVNAKIAKAEQQKVHTMFVVGKRDVEAGTVSLRVHGKGNLGAKNKDEVMAEIVADIRTRQA